MSWWTDDIGSKIMNSAANWLGDQMSDIADNLTTSFARNFKPDMSYFNSVFPSAGEYSSVFIVIGIVLIVAIFSFSLLFMLLGGITGNEEDPFKVIGRVALAFFLTYNAHSIMDVIYGIGVDITELFDIVNPDVEWSTASSIFDFLIVDGISILLKLILGSIILWNILKLFLEIMERYLVMCLYWFFSPIANATFASKGTAKIFSSFYSAVITQVFICSLNTWFLRMTADVCIRMAVDVSTPGQVLMQSILIIAWLTVAQRIDQYLKSMGLSVAQTGGNIVRSIMSTVFTFSQMGNMVSKGVAASKKMNAGDVVGYKDATGKSHTTLGNRQVADAANMNGGVMNEKNHVVPNQDAYMSTDNKGNATATIVGEAASKVVENSNMPGYGSNSINKESLKAGAKQGESFRVSYNTTDGGKVSGHISRLPEENGMKGFATRGASGEIQYTYYDKGSAMATGTGLERGQTSTLRDANMATASLDESGNINMDTGAWNMQAMEAVGLGEANMDSQIVFNDEGRVEIFSEDGDRFGTVVLPDNEQFEAAKSLGNYYEDYSNGNRMVGIPESKLDNLGLEPEEVSSYANVRKIIGDNAIVKGEQTLATDGIQSYVSMQPDGGSKLHQFVTAENLDYSKLNTYSKVELQDGAVLYHRSHYVNQNTKGKDTKKQKKTNSNHRKNTV